MYKIINGVQFFHGQRINCKINGLYVEGAMVNCNEENPFNKKLIRLIHEGRPVYVAAVPLVVVMTVPNTKLLLTPLTATVPVPAGIVVV